MQKLDLHDLTVDTFSTSLADDGPAFNNGPGLTDGVECTQTPVNVTCTCNCHTVKYDCV